MLVARYSSSSSGRPTRLTIRRNFPVAGSADSRGTTSKSSRTSRKPYSASSRSSGAPGPGQVERGPRERLQPDEDAVPVGLDRLPLADVAQVLEGVAEDAC